jgi:hypothetical protein
MGNSQQFDRGKFKEMVLYFAVRSAELKDHGFGMVKLNKLLYRADFEAFRTLGQSITGETYERQDYGPVARDLLLILDELTASGRLQWDRIPAGPYTREVPKVPNEDAAAPDRSMFSPQELKVMEAALSELTGLGGKAASEWSHEESAGWNVAEDDGVAIDYSTSIIATKPIPNEDLERAARFVREQGWVRSS